MEANETVRELLESYPIIAAVRDEAGLTQALASPVQVIFILHASLSDIKERVSRVKAHHKTPFVHQDMVAVLAKTRLL